MLRWSCSSLYFVCFSNLFLFSVYLSSVCQLLFCKMETYKENIRSRPRFQSKIPVPVEKLSSHPNHLLATNNERLALKTIDVSKANIAERHGEPSFKGQKHQKLKNQTAIFKRCPRQVNIYSKVDKDWAQNVYKDDEGVARSSKTIKSECKASEASIENTEKIEPNNLPTTSSIEYKISGNLRSIVKEQAIENCGSNNCRDIPLTNHDIAFIFKDGDNNNKPTVRDAERERNTTLQVTKPDKIDVTPAIPIENKGIKNIKKTLKRPHSRELQCLSPIKNLSDQDIKVKRRLMFERPDNKKPSLDIWAEAYTKSLVKDYTDDIFQYLLSIERKLSGAPTSSNAIRTCFINWILKLNGRNGNPLLVQVACWYLDSFLSRAVVPMMQIQLVAAACYWIAQKLNGPVYSAPKLVRYGCNVYTADDLRQMEMKVLCMLRFPCQPVVPQEFITYMSWWLGENEQKEIEMAATFLCLAALMVNKLVYEEYPSVIASAAMRCALVVLNKTHLLNRLTECHVYRNSMLKYSKLPLSSIIYESVRTISRPTYKYNILLEYYGVPPLCTSQKIVEALKKMSDSSSSLK